MKQNNLSPNVNWLKLLISTTIKMKITRTNYAQQTELERDCLCLYSAVWGDGGKLQRRRAVVPLFHISNSYTLLACTVTLWWQNGSVCQNKAWAVTAYVFKCQKANRLQIYTRHLLQFPLTISLFFYRGAVNQKRWRNYSKEILRFESCKKKRGQYITVLRLK